MGKLKLRIKDFKYGTATKDLEQSKTPKEEQCKRIGNKVFLSPLCSIHNPHTKLVREGTLSKTEDTGECGREHVHDYWNCCAACIHGEHPSEGASGHTKDCRYFKASGVSKEATNEDSCDTLSPSENKEESMEDRFDEEFMDGKMSKLLLRDGNARLMKLVKLFIQSEISKAVAKERESILSNSSNYNIAVCNKCRGLFKASHKKCNSKKGKE